MRIALISYEFPPETGGGGIGTYLAQIAPLLAALGHDVFVFSGSRTVFTRHEPLPNLQVFRIPCTDSPSFRDAVVPVFNAEHAARAFDVCEGTDFDASALSVKRAHPALPCVVKLHTPRFVIDELHQRPPTLFKKMRMTLGAWRRGRRFHTASIREQPAAREEIAFLNIADEIAAPSQAIADAAFTWVQRDPRRVSVFPYPYVPSEELLAIPVKTETRRITFLGRLEERKGVLDLAEAIPLVLARNPDCRFRFIGRAMHSPRTGTDMRDYLRSRLYAHRNSVDFTGVLAPEGIPAALAETDVLVAPSHWESFGLVCCEGMAAGRAVIGSANGGMAEIIGTPDCGLLVPPHSPARLADAILDLINNPQRRHEMGAQARQRILSHFSAARVVAAQLDSYQQAIDACKNTTA